jgi:hypothetical protein
MEKPTLEFFATLGQYVYQYIDSDGKVYYTGKGNGDRCYAHVTNKEFNPEHCYIVARNLEKFEDKKDWQSFLLESYLIATQNPDGNSVSGHYKECFVMASLSSMFTNFKSDQYDMFESLPQWYIDNYDTFRGRLREVNLNATTAFFLSNARNKMYMMWWWNPNSGDPVKVTFEINLPDGDSLSSQKETMKKWLATNGHKKIHDDGKVQKFAIFVDNIDGVVLLFKEFMS